MLQPLFEVRRYNGDVVTHSHDFHQVVLPLEGRLSMVVSGTEGYVSSDSVALVAACESHSFTGSKSNSFLVTDIPTRSWVATDALGAKSVVPSKLPSGWPARLLLAVYTLRNGDER